MTTAAAGKDFDSAAALKDMSNMGVTQMPAMLSMMEGMYSNWKGKISAANKKEEEEKKSFEEQIHDLDKKKTQYKDDANATKTYDFIEKYWKRQRDISHRQYHTTLKLMHSGMQKFKTMIGAYKSVLAGKKPTQQQMAAVGAMMPPEVVLLQVQVKELTAWATGASAILRDARHPHPGTQTDGDFPARS